MWTLIVVVFEIIIEVGLHLFDRLVPVAATHHLRSAPEVGGIGVQRGLILPVLLS